MDEPGIERMRRSAVRPPVLAVREESAPRAPGRYVLAILGPAVALALGAFVATRFVHTKPLLALLDNVHWTVSYIAAACLGWLAVRYATDAERAPRRAFALGLSAYAIGQVLWDLQVALGWNPFPGPSDVFYLMLGPFCTAGLLWALRSRASSGQLRTAALDVTGLCVAALTCVLALYLPLRGKSTALQMAVTVAYPVGFLVAACVALVIVPTLRLRLTRGWWLFLGALVANGWLWMEWNARSLAGTLDDGSAFNAGFSLAAFAMGLGALAWRPAVSPDARWERRCEGALRLLPLLLVVGAAGAVLIAFTFPGVPSAVQVTTAWAGAVVVIISLVRQSVLLHERDRMLEAESQFRTLFDSAQDAILLMNETGFLDCNPSAERLFGLPRGALCMLGPLDLSPEVQLDGRPSQVAAAERIAAALRGDNQRFEWRHHRHDGTPIDTEVSLDRVVLPWGQMLLAVVRDVTERREAEAMRGRLEEQLRHSARLEAVGRLAGGVAHDFNNILTVILGTAEMALMRVKDAPTQKDLAEIRRSAQRAASLTAQLLAFSRKQVIAPVPTDLNALVASALVMLRRLIGEDVELGFEPCAAPGAILVDPTQLEQVLINLAVNARDAMPEGGQLRITTARVDVGEDECRRQPDAREGRYVCLEVRDDGPGIPQDIIPHVFEPFYTTKEFGRGTGLGLSTVYGIVRRSDGFIELASDAGRGACFRIHFPEIADAVRPAPTPAAHSVQQGCEHILLVEDEATVRELAQRLLRDLGYAVSTAASGAEALERAGAASQPIDLLLTDVIMPGMSGRDLHAELVRRHGDVPVVFMSGYTDNIIAPHGVLDPGTHFLQKPFALEDLSGIVREVLDARDAHRAA